MSLTGFFNPVRAGESLLTSCSELLQRRQWQPTPALLPGKSHGRRCEAESYQGSPIYPFYIPPPAPRWKCRVRRGLDRFTRCSTPTPRTVPKPNTCFISICWGTSYVSDCKRTGEVRRLWIKRRRCRASSLYCNRRDSPG